jgi:nucleoside-diphosphate-sugar epimerase
VAHCAAVIGGTWTTATAEDFDTVNYRGVENLLDAARRVGNPRCVLLSSAAILDRTVTMTETSPLLAIDDSNPPYAKAKLSAYYLAMYRASRGQDALVVVPGGIYGPAIFVERALVPTCFNSTVLLGIRGELSEYLPGAMSWVTATDVARATIAAIERGVSGRRYLALGPVDQMCSLPALCNQANALLGIDHRVAEIDLATASAEKYGTMIHYARRIHVEPAYDDRVTRAELGLEWTSVADGLGQTLAWMREAGRLPPGL